MTTASPPESAFASPEAARAVRAQVARAGSSFFWSMRLLPPVQREAIYAVYAFCRAVDDVADGPEPARRKLEELAAWRREVDKLYAGAPEAPISRILARHTARFQLPRAEFEAILDGMEQDARGGLVAPTMAELRGYCRQVAGAVGVLAMQIFARDDPRATPARRREIAETLGEALQFTNILRDLGPDAAEGRLYLPREVLETAGVTARTPAGVLSDPARRAACSGLAATARRRFHRARSLLDEIDPRSARPCRLMLEVYARLLSRIEAEGFPTARRVRLRRRDKAWVVLRHGLL